MSHRIVWVAGPPGSGKTTAARGAAERLHRPFEAAGALFREAATRSGRSLTEYSRYAEAHAEVDRALDDQLMARARPGTVLDGRVVGALLRRRGTDVLAVRVTAEEPVRARRIAGRDGVSEADALTDLRQRAASERARYLHWYGIDLDTEPYDVVVDSSALSAAAVTDALVERIRADEVRA